MIALEGEERLLSTVKHVRPNRKKKRFTLDDVQLFFLSLPTLIWYLLFCYLPMFGLIFAFKKYKVAPGKGFLWSLFNNSQWCGLENFRFLFANNKETTINMFRNTVGYNIVFIVLGVVLPVTLAIMISNLKSQKVAKVTQTAMFLPHFLSWVVVGYFVFAFLSTDNGLVNRLIISMGGSPIKWYQKDAIGYWPFFLVFLHVWKTIGYSMVVYLSPSRASTNP
jgi:putative aldouronate transport system permease protein